jgi:hypothetical protein
MEIVLIVTRVVGDTTSTHRDRVVMIMTTTNGAPAENTVGVIGTTDGVPIRSCGSRQISRLISNDRRTAATNLRNITARRSEAGRRASSSGVPCQKTFGRRLPSHQGSDRLLPEDDLASGSDDVSSLRRVIGGFTCIRLSDTYRRRVFPCALPQRSLP